MVYLSLYRYNPLYRYTDYAREYFSLSLIHYSPGYVVYSIKCCETCFTHTVITISFVNVMSNTFIHTYTSSSGTPITFFIGQRTRNILSPVVLTKC